MLKRDARESGGRFFVNHLVVSQKSCIFAV